MLKQFIKRADDKQFVLTILNIFNNIISGEYICEFFHFSGTEDSFISLKTPLNYPIGGVCCTGYFLMETSDSNKTQCIFSFMQIIENDVKGVELYIINKKIVYKMINGIDTWNICFDNSEIRTNTWHHITIAHTYKDLTIYLDENVWVKENIEALNFIKSYNYATFGASIDYKTKNPKFNFNGLMSAFGFFNPCQKVTEVLAKISSEENVWKYSILNEEFSKLHTQFFIELPPMENIKAFHQVLSANSLILIDPRVQIKLIIIVLYIQRLC